MYEVSSTLYSPSFHIKYPWRFSKRYIRYILCADVKMAYLIEFVKQTLIIYFASNLNCLSPKEKFHSPQISLGNMSYSILLHFQIDIIISTVDTYTNLYNGRFYFIFEPSSLLYLTQIDISIAF